MASTRWFNLRPALYLVACWLLALLHFGAAPPVAVGLEPIPDKLVVLTFDDSAKSHHSRVRPILKRYGFGATFFITEGFDFATNKTDYMTWEEIAELARDGFEIGNHTRDHLGVTKDNVAKLAEQVEAINQRCAQHGIPRTTSFGYPGNSFAPEALSEFKKLGIRFARRGGSPEYEYREGRGFAYEPGFDHPLLIPSAGDARPDWTLDNFVQAIEQARHGRIAVLQFHGVPDTAHAWVNTLPDRFDDYMNYLAKQKCTVIAMRDLARYVDADVVPSQPSGIIEDRKRSLQQQSSRENFRRPKNDEDLQYWLRNMLVDHGYSVLEASAATGLSVDEISAAAERFQIAKSAPIKQSQHGQPLKVLPYPGGRHPRTGFLDGAIRPQRETKISVFLPWDPTQYVVADVPEALWMRQPEGRQLLYLAHTHVPTLWDKQAIQLPPLEWSRGPDGTLQVERTLPNQVRFGAKVVPTPQAVRMELWITNGTHETLTGLVVQNCVMLKNAEGFNALTAENKIIRDPYVACHDADKKRWIITAWQDCVRPWANPPCPCMHSDPQFPDCPAGETRRLHGWLSFYEGPNIDAELDRIDHLDWRSGK